MAARRALDREWIGASKLGWILDMKYHTCFFSEISAMVQNELMVLMGRSGASPTEWVGTSTIFILSMSSYAQREA